MLFVSSLIKALAISLDSCDDSFCAGPRVVSVDSAGIPLEVLKLFHCKFADLVIQLHRISSGFNESL